MLNSDIPISRNNRAMLVRLMDLAQADPEVSRWLAGAVRECQEGGNLAAALGLDGAHAIRDRDYWLCQAARLLAGPNRSDWAIAGDLLAAIRRFERNTLPKLRRGHSVELSELETELSKAFNSGARMLRSQKRIREVIADE